MVFSSQNDPEINTFCTFVEECGFRENHCFSYVKSLFFMCRATKNRTKIEFKTRWKKGGAKIEFRVDLESIFEGFGAPKCLQTISEIEVKQTLKMSAKMTSQEK